MKNVLPVTANTSNWNGASWYSVVDAGIIKVGDEVYRHSLFQGLGGPINNIAGQQGLFPVSEWIAIKKLQRYNVTSIFIQ